MTLPPGLHTILAGVALGCVVAFAAGSAQAHALLQQASPAVGGIVTKAPAVVTMLFSEAVEPRFSKVSVTGPDGSRVDRADLHVDAGDPKRLVLGVRPLTPGTYTVEWHAVSVDTHRTEGRFRFTLAGG